MLLQQTTVGKEIIKYGYLTSGGIMQGTAMALFLFPHNIPSGGAAGLAILMNVWLHFPLGVALWVVNFSMLVLAIRYFGYAWTLRTTFSVTITSLTITFFEAFWDMPHIHLALDLVCGSLLFGLGVGTLIKYGASSGGMVIPALMIASLKRSKPGKAMFWINLFIFVLTATVIDVRIVIYAVACQWLSTKIIDLRCAQSA